MRCYKCYIYHLQNKKLVQNSNYSCWAGLNRARFSDDKGDYIILDSKTKDYIYIDFKDLRNDISKISKDLEEFIKIRSF